MMKKLRFLVFLIFNLAYKDGNYDKKNDSPYFASIIAMIAFEFLLLLFGIDFLNLFVDFDIFNTLKSLYGTKRGLVIALLALLALPNYYFFIKKKRFDRYYNEFKDAEMNTKSNRKIGYICLILYLPIWLALVVLFKS